MAKYEYKVHSTDAAPGRRGDKPAAQDTPVAAPRAANPFTPGPNGETLPKGFGKRKVKNQPKPQPATPAREVDAQKVSDLNTERFAQREAAQRESESRFTLRTGEKPRGKSSLHNSLTEKVDLLNTMGRPSGQKAERWRTLRNPVTDENGQPKKDAAGNHVLQSYSSLDEAKADITAKRQAEAERRAGVAKSIADANAPKVIKSSKPKKVAPAPKAAKPAFIPKKVK